MIEYIPYKQASEDMQSEQIHEDLKVLKKDIKKQPKESKEFGEIPPNIKDLYKLFSLTDKQKLVNTIFYMVIKDVSSTEYMSGKVFDNFIDDFSKYIESPRGKKADIAIKQMFGIESQNHIAIKKSKIAYESTNNQSSKIQSIVLYIPGEDQSSQIPLLVLKQVYNQNGVYEVRSLYTSSQKTVIIPKNDGGGKYHLEDVDGKKFQGRYTIGLDGNLYEIDENMQILFPSGERITYKKEYFVGLRDSNVSISTNEEGTFIFPQNTNDEKNMRREKIETKKQIIQEKYKEYELYTQGYILEFGETGDVCYLKKDGVQSEESPSIFLFGEEKFDIWFQSAKQKIDEKLKVIEAENKQIEKKEKIFTDFLAKYCDTEIAGMSGIFSLKENLEEGTEIEKKYIAALKGYFGAYGIKKGEITNNNRPLAIDIIDLSTNKKIEQNFYYPADIADAKGNINLVIIENIFMSIKRYENKNSYMGFFTKYNDKNPEEVKYGYFEKMSYNYKNKSYTIEFNSRDRIMDTIETDGGRPYQLYIRGNEKNMYISITKNMTGEDIEKAINTAIDG